MKFRFITLLHNLKLESDKNKGIQLSKRGRISNGKYIRNSLETNLMRGTLGVHSIDEFDGKTYYYLDGDLQSIEDQTEMDKLGTKLTFLLLRDIQEFTYDLWRVKDNNVYIRDGFLITYQDKIENGYTFKASVSSMFCKSNLDREETIFTDEELKRAINTYEFTDIEDAINLDHSWKYGNEDHFYKKYGSERAIRALYFVLAARASNSSPIKIVNYCTALECLFTSTKTEINHKIAERVALLLADGIEERRDLYKTVKAAYNVRSTIVHGSSIKGEQEKIQKLSQEMDSILRLIMTSNLEIFKFTDDELEDHFLKLIMG